MLRPRSISGMLNFYPPLPYTNIVAMTKVRNTLMLFTAVAVLLGAIPHQSLYCRMMKQEVTARMMECCVKHHQNPGGAFFGSKMLETFKKPTLSAFEHSGPPNVIAIAVTSDINPTMSFPAQSTGRISPLEIEYPPPDPVIRNLNLRI